MEYRRSELQRTWCRGHMVCARPASMTCPTVAVCSIAWAVVALMCEAAFTVLAVPLLRRHGAWGVSLHTVWIAAAMLLVLGALIEGPQAALRLRATIGQPSATWH
jgi:hypothetical protein